MKWQQYLDIYLDCLYYIADLRYKNKSKYCLYYNLLDKYFHMTNTSVEAIALKILCFQYGVDQPFSEWFAHNEDKLVEGELPNDLQNLITECLLGLL